MFQKLYEWESDQSQMVPGGTGKSATRAMELTSSFALYHTAFRRKQMIDKLFTSGASDFLDKVSTTNL